MSRYAFRVSEAVLFWISPRVEMGVAMGNVEKNEVVKLGKKTAAGKGLIGRRALLRNALFSAGIAAASAGVAQADDSVGADAPDWMKTPGRQFSSYGHPSKWQEKAQRPLDN